MPSHIQEHIDYVTPGTRLRQRSIKGRRHAKRDAVDSKIIFKPLITKLPGFPHPNSSDCDVYVTRDCTRGMYARGLLKHVSNRHYSVQYSIPDSTTAAPGNELGIFESLDVHYSRKDLDIYFSTLYP